MAQLWTDRQHDYLSRTNNGKIFLAELPDKVDMVANLCGLTVLGPAGSGSTSIALEAEGTDGRKYVLKVDPDAARSTAASAVMGEWAQVGVSPRVYRSGVDWYLMEWIEGFPVPRPLDDLNPLAKNITEALTTAWLTPMPASAYFDRFGWVLPLTAQRLREANHPAFSAGMAEKAELLIPELRSGCNLGACHGDPVGGNILIQAGKAFLIDPVPHEDPFEALVSHWAVRARNGSDVLYLARFMSSHSGLVVDEEALCVWAGIQALTFTAYNFATGHDVPGDAYQLTNVLR